MTPIDLHRYHQQHSTDLISDCVLDVIASFKQATTTQKIVDYCSETGLSSPATTHKKIGVLKQLGLIESVNQAQDTDRRKNYLRTTDHGAKYLRGWEK